MATPHVIQSMQYRRMSNALLPSYWRIRHGIKTDILCLLTSSILRAGPLTPNLEISRFIISITVSRQLASSSILYLQALSYALPQLLLISRSH